MNAKTNATHDITWARAQELGEFRSTDLMLAAGVGPSVAHRHISIWEGKGLIEVVRKEPSGRVFRVIANEPAPSTGPKIVETAFGNMWRSMRMMREFSPIDLAAHSTTDTVKVSEDEALDYCAALTRAGYLRMTKRHDDPTLARYRLLRNTGPKPPRERRVRGIEDENTGTFIRFAGRAK